jgi:hypothetical protein
MGRTCSTNERKEDCMQVVGGKARKKGPLGRPRRRWVDGSYRERASGPVNGFCEHSIKPSGPIKQWEVIE